MYSYESLFCTFIYKQKKHSSLRSGPVFKYKIRTCLTITYLLPHTRCHNNKYHTCVHFLNVSFPYRKRPQGYTNLKIKFKQLSRILSINIRTIINYSSEWNITIVTITFRELASP